MLNITQLKTKCRNFVFNDNKIRPFLFFLAGGLLCLLFTTPFFSPLKNILTLILEKVVYRQSLDQNSWIHVQNSYLITASYFLFIISLYAMFVEKGKTIYFFPAMIIITFTASNIYLLRTGFMLGYSNVWDFNDFLTAIPSYAAKDFYGSNYPPLAVGLFKLMFRLFPRDSSINTEYVLKYLLTLYFVFTIVSLFVLFQKSIKENEKHKFLLAGVFFLTGPLLFTYQRMNLMHLALIFTMVFVLYYDSPYKLKRFLALFSLAVAANIKYFPAVFGLILIKEKKWKDALICFAAGVFLFIFPAFLPHMAQSSAISTNPPAAVSTVETVSETIQIAEQPVVNPVVPSTDAVHNESAPSKIGMIISSTKRFITNSNAHVMASINAQAISVRTAKKLGITSEKTLGNIMILALVVFLMLSLSAFFTAKNRHSQMLILGLISVMAPPASAWYGLIFLFIPFFELLKKEAFSPAEHMEFILYCLIFIFVMDQRFRFFMPVYSWHIVLLFFTVFADILISFIKSNHVSFNHHNKQK